MSTIKRASWHPLNLSTPLRSAPPLLVQSTFTPASYTIRLTDFTSVWQESLTRREILHRATQQSTPIDPTEDPSQLSILLEKLQQAIATSTDAEVELFRVAAEGNLKLVTKTPLPSPLPELPWTFELSPCAGVELANHLILPLMGEVAMLRDMVESLVGLVEDKDAVIERVAGDDIKSLIGGGGGRRRKRGLERFDVEKWKGGFVSGDRRAKEVVEEVFGGEGAGEARGGVKGLGGEAAEWWRGLEVEADDRAVRRPEVRRKVAVGVGKKGSGKAIKSEDEGEDVFEAQKTPPRRAKKPIPSTPLRHVQQDDTASGEDGDDDLGAAPPRRLTSTPKSRSGPPTAASPPARRGIGKIGGRKKTSYAPALVPPPSVQMVDAAVDETADEDGPLAVGKKGKGKGETDTEDEEMSAPPLPPAPAVAEGKPPLVARKIGKIGKIGGKKAAPVHTPTPTPVPGEDVEMKDEVVQSSTRPLLHVPTPPAIKSSPETTEDEDEDAKADRKRQQLAKELEAKKKATVKKKRKF